MSLLTPPQELVEIISYSVSEALVLEDPTLGFTQAAVEYLVAGMVGCLGVLRGVQDGKNTRVFIVVGWDSIVHYQDARKKTDYSVIIPSSLRPNFEETIETRVVQFDVYPHVAFNAPVTELTTFKMKEDCDALRHGEEILKSVTDMHNAPKGGASTVGRFLPLSWGTGVKKNMFVLALGWESAKVHKQFIKVVMKATDQEKSNLRGVYAGVTDIDISHVALSTCWP